MPRPTATKKRSDLQEERDGLYEKDKKAVAALAAAQQNLDKLTKEVEGLRTEIRTVQTDRDKQFEQVVKTTDQVHQIKGELTRVKEREQQLAAQVAQAKKVLAANNLKLDSDTDKIAPVVQGKVLAVNKNDLVEVSIGSDDGLKAGHKLEVFRGSSYLGRLEVLSTSEDKAVGKIMSDYKKGQIQRGDNVATRFKLS